MDNQVTCIKCGGKSDYHILYIGKQSIETLICRSLICGRVYRINGFSGAKKLRYHYSRNCHCGGALINDGRKEMCLVCGYSCFIM